MDSIVIHEGSKTVEIGAGLTWTDVYAYLVPKGINVVGARLGAVGVAGFTLGGGDSSLFEIQPEAVRGSKNLQDTLGKPANTGLLWII
jgi:hypothetical protein